MEHETSILYTPVNRLWQAIGMHGQIPDHVIMAFLVLVISAVLFPLATRNLSKENPGYFQQFLESMVAGMKGLLDEIIGHGGAERFINVIAGYAVFIFIGNLFGLFFFLQPPTANVNTTFALSVSAFLYYNILGIRKHGLIGYLKHFMGPLLWLAPLMFLIEMVGNFARVLSLGMRLFGNIFGEHTATGIFFGFFPLALPWPMMALGVFGATLQTFVFIMLFMVYIGGAVSAEEH